MATHKLKAVSDNYIDLLAEESCVIFCNDNDMSKWASLLALLGPAYRHWKVSALRTQAKEIGLTLGQI